LWSQEHKGNYVDPENWVLIFHFSKAQLIHQVCYKPVNLIILDLTTQYYNTHY
jgi:hypothetical protein